MPTDIRAFLQTRRSVRRFKPDPVPDSVLTDILHTATFAPSAHNTQPWRFAIVKGIPARQNLGTALTHAMQADMQAEGAPEADIEARITRSLRRIMEAPVVILLCRDVTAVREHKPQDTIMAIQSVAAAALQLLLAAHAEGLGGNWICWPLYAQESARASIQLPETWEPQAMLFLGYPAEIPQPKEKKPMEEIVKTFELSNA